jgi:hypothetical protein
LYLEYGYEGLGLFYTILEKLALQEKPIKTKVLKHQLNVGKKLDKVWEFIEQIDLISTNNGETFNKQLLNFSKKYQVSKEKNAKRILEWRENQSVSENVTHSELVRNANKVKESKVKESKVKLIDIITPHIFLLGDEYENFYSYWTEQNDKGKERWEAEKYFDITRRISTWMKNNNKFSNSNNNHSQEPVKGKHQKNFENLYEIEQKLLKQIEDGTFNNPFSRK